VGVDLVLGQEGSYIVFSFKLILELDLFVLLGQGVSLSVLLPSIVYNNKVIFSKCLSLSSLLAYKLLCCYKVFK
jgi:hypothetical protein